MPNKPKTPIRGFRIPDDVYLPAQEAAGLNDETVTDVVVRALKAYARKHKPPTA